MRNTCLILIASCFFIASNAWSSSTEKAYFAGGCFWCMEPPFDALKGVISTTSGYIGGEAFTANYEQVSSGLTGHREAIEVVYDPDQVSFSSLLEVFWQNVDYLDDEGQFCDRGFQYTAAVYVQTSVERRQAENSKAKIIDLTGLQVVTPIIEFSTFYKAEDYHQDYYQNNPVRYKYYRYRCGRDERLSTLKSQSTGTP